MNIIKHIPNTITSLNLLCGSLGVICASKGLFDWAFYLMIFAAVADFCDGLAARLLDAYSPMGKELDSLADMVSFGLLPSGMLYFYMTINGSFGWYCFVPLVISVFSGLRLAKFNIDERQTENFIGLATPACAILCASLVSFAYFHPDTFIADWAGGPVFLPLLSVVLAFLLVSEIPMFSMKIKKGGSGEVNLFRGKNLLRVIFFACTFISTVLTLILGCHFSLILLLSFVSYILINIIGALFRV